MLNQRLLRPLLFFKVLSVRPETVERLVCYEPSKNFNYKMLTRFFWKLRKFNFKKNIKPFIKLSRLLKKGESSGSLSGLTKSGLRGRRVRYSNKYRTYLRLRRRARYSYRRKVFFFNRRSFLSGVKCRLIDAKVMRGYNSYASTSRRPRRLLVSKMRRVQLDYLLSFGPLKKLKRRRKYRRFKPKFRTFKKTFKKPNKTTLLDVWGSTSVPSSRDKLDVLIRADLTELFKIPFLRRLRCKTRKRFSSQRFVRFQNLMSTFRLLTGSTRTYAHLLKSHKGQRKTLKYSLRLIRKPLRKKRLRYRRKLRFLKRLFFFRRKKRNSFFLKHKKFFPLGTTKGTGSRSQETYLNLVAHNYFNKKTFNWSVTV